MTAWDDGPTCKVWTPSLLPDNGDSVPVFSGEDNFYIFNDSDIDGGFTFETRSARRVIRDSYIRDGAGDSVGWLPRGSELDRQIFPLPETGWEWKVKFYIKLGLVSLEVQDGVYYQGWWVIIDTRTGTPSVASIGGTLYNQTNGYYDWVAGHPLPDTTGWTDDGWYEIGLRITSESKVQYQVKPELAADNWLTVPTPFIFNSGVSPVLAPYLWTRRVSPDDPSAVVDLWSYQWSNL